MANIGLLNLELEEPLTPLANEIIRQADLKRDWVLNTAAMRMDGGLRFHFGTGSNEQELAINDYAHGQIAAFTGIPRKYYDLMRREKPELLANNVNSWFKSKEAKRMVRTMDGHMRAFLSDTYKRRDNLGVAESIIPMMEDLHFKVISADITESRLYIKAVDEAIERDVPKGAVIGDNSHTIFDTHVPAMCLSNSEIGCGATVLELGTLRRMCTNLAWFASEGMRRVHLGARIDTGADNYRLLTDETKDVMDHAFYLELRDTLKHGMSGEAMDKRMAKITGTIEREITGDLNKVVELVGDHFGMGATTKSSVLKHLATGGKLNQYHLAQAITRAATDETNYDASSAYEEAGGALLDLSAAEWKALNSGHEIRKLKGGDLKLPELLEAA